MVQSTWCRESQEEVILAAVAPLRMAKEENARSQYFMVLVTFSFQTKQKSFSWLGQSFRLRSHQYEIKGGAEGRRK